MMSSAESNFVTSLRTFGVIEAISKYGEQNSAKSRGLSIEDYVGKITAIFSPYISQSISEKQFTSVQMELKKVLSDFNKSKKHGTAFLKNHN